MSPSPDDLEILATFTTEACELLDEVEPQLVELEKAFRSSEVVERGALDRVFRLMHSLKSSASYLQLERIARLTHLAEGILDGIRGGIQEPCQDTITLLIRTCDLLRAMLGRAAESHHDEVDDGAFAELEAELSAGCPVFPSDGPPPALPEERPEPAADGVSPLDSSSAAPALITSDIMGIFAHEGLETLAAADTQLEALAAGPDTLGPANELRKLMHRLKGNSGIVGLDGPERLARRAEELLEEVLAKRLRASSDVCRALAETINVLRDAVEEVPRGRFPSSDRLDRVLDQLGLAAAGPEAAFKSAPAAVGPAPPVEPPSQPEEPEPPTQPAGESVAPVVPVEHAGASSLRAHEARVRLDKLDRIMDLVGELVIAESSVRLCPDLEGLELDRFDKSVRQLNKITRELQDASTAIRMVPIRDTFRRLLRVVRDLAARQGKEVDLVLEGEDTEVDRTIIDEIAPSLIHIVRNAVDHGIEPPAQRVAADKPPAGRLVVDAQHVGGEVWLAVTDDGRGLARDRILARAEALGLVDGGASVLGDDEVWKLVFRPGFSTAAEVTDVSGRGVGLDVVTRSLERLRGRVDIRTAAGVGTTVLLRIPLTLAIIEAMLVRSGRGLYALPLTSIVQCYQPSPTDLVRAAGGATLARFRDQMCPITELTHGTNGDPREGILVAVEHADRPLCIHVDELLGQHQVVVKPLPAYLTHAERFAGCSILGDGTVCLIVDVERTSRALARGDAALGRLDLARARQTEARGIPT